MHSGRRVFLDFVLTHKTESSPRNFPAIQDLCHLLGLPTLHFGLLERLWNTTKRGVLSLSLFTVLRTGLMGRLRLCCPRKFHKIPRESWPFLNLETQPEVDLSRAGAQIPIAVTRSIPVT